MVESVEKLSSDRMYQDELKSILNGIDALITVCTVEEGDILFLNNSILDYFGIEGDFTGKKCYKILQQQDEPCEACPFSQLLEQPDTKLNWIHKEVIKGRTLHKTARLINWPGTGKAHLEYAIDITDIIETQEALAKREKMLGVLHKAATVMLSQNRENYEDTMTEGAAIVATIAGIDKISVYRNIEEPDGMYVSQIYRWRKAEDAALPLCDSLIKQSYAGFIPQWWDILSSGKCINGPAHIVPDADALTQFECLSVLAVPVFNNGVFWGIVLFDNCTEACAYSDDEVEILTAASYMLSNAVIRQEDTRDALLAEERVRLMLDATPLACRLWDRDFNIVECNEAGIKLYGLKDKDEYIRKFFDLLPEYQPDGQRSIDKIYDGVRQAFETGASTYKIIFRLPDGTPFPAENRLFRVRCGDDYMVAAYSRDLREEKRMLRKIESTSAKLEIALAEAEIANNAKSTFLANMSHEIRTPMNSILGITEMLVHDPTLPDQVVSELNRIYKSCDLLMGILNDILDFSKIEAGKLDIVPAPYKIANLISDTVQLNMMRSTDKALDLELEIDENICANLVGDELRIKQILNNLLSNAFKYTDSGVITLHVGIENRLRDDVTLVLTVRDTGIGMTEEQLAELFDEYTRFDQDSRRSTEGTGLGMAITQRLVSLMDGEIRVESRLGEGSVFVVKLPQKIVNDEVLCEELVQSLRNFKTFLITDTDRLPLVREHMPYGKVLIVDDMEANIHVARGLLKLYRLQIDTAMSGYDAIDKIKAGNIYDIVFMDHMMPDMDGIEATKHLRNSGYKEPIVALTANAIKEQEAIFLENGFDDFIAKPMDIRRLDTVLNRLVRDKHFSKVTGEINNKQDYHGADSSATVVDVESDPLLLAAFLSDARKALAVLEAWQSDEASDLAEALRKLTITTHGMKSTLANIGETALSDTAKELESAGRTGDAAFIKQMVPHFRQELQSLVDRLASGESDADENGYPDYLREKLEAIQKMCVDYNRKGIMDILDGLMQEKCPRKTRDIFEQIITAALFGEFEEAAEIASAYAATLN